MTCQQSAVNCLLRIDPPLAYGGKRIDHSKSRKRKKQTTGEDVIKIEQDEWIMLFDI